MTENIRQTLLWMVENHAMVRAFCYGALAGGSFMLIIMFLSIRWITQELRGNVEFYRWALEDHVRHYGDRAREQRDEIILEHEKHSMYWESIPYELRRWPMEDPVVLESGGDKVLFDNGVDDSTLWPPRDPPEA